MTQQHSKTSLFSGVSKLKPNKYISNILNNWRNKMAKKGKVEAGSTKKFAFMGFIGFLLVLGGFDLLWRQRRHSKR